MKLYVATSFDRAQKAKAVMTAAEEQGHVITFDWTEYKPLVDDGWEPDPEQAEGIAVEEVDGVLSAEGLIVLLPGGRGTHAELGAALSNRIPVVLFGDTKRDCIFYQHPMIVGSSTLREPRAIVTVAVARFARAWRYRGTVVA